MPIQLPDTKMPEAEVTLRLAISLIEDGKTTEPVSVAIDGAQVRTGRTVHFPIVEFLNSMGWHGSNQNDRWQCTYAKTGYSATINVHSSSGEGDLVAALANGQRLRVESKKGPLSRSKSSPEYPLIREAIGQLMTIEKADSSDILAVVVPSSPKFESLASQWRERPLMKSARIRIATIDRQNVIRGLDEIN